VTAGCAVSLVVSLSVPVWEPRAVGEKRSFIICDVPAFTLSDPVGLTMLNGGFGAKAGVTLRVDVPVLAIVMFMSFVAPGFTGPKSRVGTVTEIVGPVPVPEPGIVIDPGPAMVNIPAPEPVVPAPVPIAVTLKLPVAPAKPPVPLAIVMVAGAVTLGVPARICARRASDPVSVPVRVPVGLPLLMVMVIGAEPATAAAARLKFELNVPVPTPVSVTFPLAETVPPETLPVPVMVSVPLRVVLPPEPAMPVPVNV